MPFISFNTGRLRVSHIKHNLPVFYSKQTCPFCIRARLALAPSGVICELREVDLQNKPQELLQASPKGTVPVLVLPDGQVLEESMEIVHWAIQQGDILGLMQTSIPQSEVDALIERNDTEFIKAVLRLKFPERFDDSGDRDWKAEASEFLKLLEKRLEHRRYLAGDRITLADIAIVPFVLQYADLNPAILNDKHYEKVGYWLEGFKHSDLYRRVMTDYPVWQKEMPPLHFPV